MESEVVTEIFENEKLRVEKILSFGVISVDNFWYDQDCDEWAQVTKGNAILEFELKIIELNQGESYYIQAHMKHRVKYTSNDCEWLCVFIK